MARGGRGGDGEHGDHVHEGVMSTGAASLRRWLAELIGCDGDGAVVHGTEWERDREQEGNTRKLGGGLTVMDLA